MWTRKVTICVRGADIVDPCNHENRHAALDDRTNQCCKPLSSKDGSWCNVEVVGQLHVSDESVKLVN